MTDAELKNAGIPRAIFEEWQFVMDAIWKTLLGRNSTRLRNSGDNTMIWKDDQSIEWEIKANMVNDRYIEVELLKAGRERASFIHDGNIRGICWCIVTLVRA